MADSSRAVLPGVTVTLKSAEALGQYTGVTDAQGQYRVTNLPPATYEARAELQGFQTALQKVTVRINSTVTLEFTLSVGSMAETVTVSAEAPTVDPERAGLAVNINNEALTALPVSTQRRYQDIWALVPGVFVRPLIRSSAVGATSAGGGLSSADILFERGQANRDQRRCLQSVQRGRGIWFPLLRCQVRQLRDQDQHRPATRRAGWCAVCVLMSASAHRSQP